MHILTDAQLVVGVCSGLVLLGLNGLTLWRSLMNGRNIATVGHALDVGLDDVRKEAAIARKALANVERLLEARAAASRSPTPYGRRATDVPMRSPTPSTGPEYDPRNTSGGTWPMGA